jgi:hypothetical protein
MSEAKSGVGTSVLRSESAKGSWSRWVAIGRDGLRDTVAGVVAAVVLIANIVSFGALMFPGDFSAGIPLAVWSMLIGACICGVWIALTTSLPPIATGIDSPTGTVLVLLSALAGSRVVAAGGSPQTAVQTVMLLFTIATLLSGTLLYLLGACRWGSYFRFVPFSVVGGFLAATGCILVAGGIRMITGGAPSIHTLAAHWTFWRRCEAWNRRPRARRPVGSARLGQMGLGYARGTVGDVAWLGRRAAVAGIGWRSARLVPPFSWHAHGVDAAYGDSHIASDLADPGPPHSRIVRGAGRRAHLAHHQSVKH